MLGGEPAVLQAPVFDGLPFDPFTLSDDGFGPAEIGVGGRHVAKAFMVSSVIIVVDEGADLGFEVYPFAEGRGLSGFSNGSLPGLPFPGK